MLLTWNLNQLLNSQGKYDNVKKLDNDVMSANCDVIVFFPIYGQFEAIRKPYSGRMIYKTYIFINNNPLSYKNWKQH